MRCASFVFIVSIVLLGCSSNHSIQYRSSPAVFAGIQNSTLKDISGDFRNTFCELVKADDTDSQSCNDFFFPYESVVSNSALNTSLLSTSLKNEMLIVLVPGIFGECLIKEVPPFERAIKVIGERLGIRTVTLDQVSGRASSKYNAQQIDQALTNLTLRGNEKIVLIGYSKGVTDSLVYLKNYYLSGNQPHKISAFVSITGVVNGTVIADKIGGVGDKIASALPLADCPVKDQSGIRDLSMEHQLNWLDSNSEVFQSGIPMFTVASAAERAKMSAVFLPFKTSLSNVAGPNDGQVNVVNQMLPHSYFLGVLHADHWAVILPFSDKENSDLSFLNKIVKNLATRNEFPRDALLESIIRIVDSKI